MNNEDGIRELIVRRRKQIIVHSCIYYEFNTSIISDRTFDLWAYELVDLQRKYPEISKSSRWASEFKDFDGSTGYDLPIRTQWAINKAKWLLEYEGN